MTATGAEATSGQCPGHDAATLCDAFAACVERFGDQVALRTPHDGETMTWREYAARVRSVAGGLEALGVGRGDCVGMMLRNRPECFFVDTAALHLGATPYSIPTSASPDEVAHLLVDAADRVVVCEDAFVDAILAVDAPGLEHLVVIDAQRPGLMTLAELEAEADETFDLASAARDVAPGDIATLIYTSGTTGPPKGVQLTHANLLFEWGALGSVLPPRPGGRLTSYLPFAHVADRFFGHYCQLYSGSTLTVVPDPAQIVAALPDARPTAWGGVPRVWEMLMASLLAQGIDDPHALDDGARAAVRARLGLGSVDFLLSGAATTPLAVLEYFAALGLPICEVWGMAETTAVGTACAPGAARHGSVGVALPGVELAVRDDGELLVRGPNIMAGYRGAPETTAQPIDADGWLHTGDLARIDDDGYVTIIDRKKEIIVTASGRNLSPANVEQRLRAASPLIAHACAIGDGRPFVTALLVLDPGAAGAYAREHGIAAPSLEALAADPRIIAHVADAVTEANAALSGPEQVVRCTVLPVEWPHGGDELTPTIKLKRKPIAVKYATEIESMYDREEDDT